MQHTQSILQVHKHMHMCGSSTGKAPLSTQHLCPHPGPLTHPWLPSLAAVPTGCSLHTCSIHTLIPQAFHSCGYHKYQHRPSTLLVPWPRPEVALLVSWSSLRFDSEYMCKLHAYQDWGRYKYLEPQQPAHGTHAVFCGPTPASTTERLTHAGPCSKWFLGYAPFPLDSWSLNTPSCPSP